MTKKLYYTDSEQKQFSARVLKQEQGVEGNWYVTLSETAFYPTGGGQPCDTGHIQGIPVIGVEEIDGEIRHKLKSILPNHDHVHGVIDWERRFDHMQQHCGQHMLSAAFANVFQFETVSFHLGKEVCTIDLATEKLGEEEVKEAVKIVNKLILENRAIETKWVREEEISQYHLEKKPSVKGNIRLVIIPDFDQNACGGTHPKSTGEVGALKVLQWERHKKQTRVSFICGERVLEQFDRKHNTLLNLTKALHSPEHELLHVVEKRLLKEKEAQIEITHLKEKLLYFEAKEMIADGELIIERMFEERSFKELQQLAQIIVEQNPNCTVFFVSRNESRLQVIGAKGENSRTPCKKPILKALTFMNGKGGGTERFVQGGGDSNGSSSEVLQYIRACVQEEEV